MIHTQFWSGSRSFRVTDMTNGYKRGAKSRVLRVGGISWHESSRETEDQRHDRLLSTDLIYRLHELKDTDTYEHAVEIVRGILAQAKQPGWFGVYEEEIKSINAPRPVLTAGIQGRWGGSADEHGISLRQHDDINEWSEITHHQTYAKAYSIAAKVWDRVQAAADVHEAARILRDAGARLHGYCAMD